MEGIERRSPWRDYPRKPDVGHLRPAPGFFCAHFQERGNAVGIVPGARPSSRISSKLSWRHTVFPKAAPGRVELRRPLAKSVRHSAPSSASLTAMDEGFGRHGTYVQPTCLTTPIRGIGCNKIVFELVSNVQHSKLRINSFRRSSLSLGATLLGCRTPPFPSVWNAHKR